MSSENRRFSYILREMLIEKRYFPISATFFNLEKSLTFSEVYKMYEMCEFREIFSPG